MTPREAVVAGNTWCAELFAPSDAHRVRAWWAARDLEVVLVLVGHPVALAGVRDAMWSVDPARSIVTTYNPIDLPAAVSARVRSSAGELLALLPVRPSASVRAVCMASWLEGGVYAASRRAQPDPLRINSPTCERGRRGLVLVTGPRGVCGTSVGPLGARQRARGDEVVSPTGRVLPFPSPTRPSLVLVDPPEEDS